MNTPIHHSLYIRSQLGACQEALLIAGTFRPGDAVVLGRRARVEPGALADTQPLPVVRENNELVCSIIRCGYQGPRLRTALPGRIRGDAASAVSSAVSLGRRFRSRQTMPPPESISPKSDPRPTRAVLKQHSRCALRTRFFVSRLSRAVCAVGSSRRRTADLMYTAAVHLVDRRFNRFRSAPYEVLELR